MPNGPHPAEWKKLGTIYSIAANAPQPKIAAEFINFLINNPTAIRTMNDLMGVPASTVAQTIVDKMPNLPAVDHEQQAFVEYVEKHVPTVLAPNQPLASTSFFKTLDQIEQELAFHKVTVAQAVQDIESQAQSIF
jgi:multiple sugar transport system substrate-binding protein